MTLRTSLVAALTALTPLMATTASAASLTVGFSQIGSESGWRAAETSVSKSEAQKRNITLKIADAQQKQENQIKAIRSFVAQGVDAIFLAPVVATGWDAVLNEAKDARIPVILLLATWSSCRAPSAPASPPTARKALTRRSQSIPTSR